MNWTKYITITLINTLGIVVGIILIPVSQALPQIELNSQGTELKFWQEEALNSQKAQTLINNYNQVKTLKELEKIQEILTNELAGKAQNNNLNFSIIEQQKTAYYQKLEQLLVTVDQRIKWEKEVEKVYQSAEKLAEVGLKISQGSNSVNTRETAKQYLLNSISTLRQIPQKSVFGNMSVQKIIEYQGYLAVNTYEQQTAESAVNSQEKPKSKPALVSVSPPGIDFYGDTNRDGVINGQDETGKNRWSWSNGALMLFNNDDDNNDKKPDWQDEEVDGDEDSDDLAMVKLQLSRKFSRSEIYLTTDAEDIPHINLFQKTSNGWQPVDLSGKKPIKFRRKITLGMEAKQFADRNWRGVINLKVTLKKDGEEIATDAMQIGVVPWIMSPNTAQVTELHVSDRGTANQQFIAEIQQILNSNNTKTKIVPGGTVSMQDTMKIGYVQFPQKRSLETINVTLKGNRGEGQDNYAKSLLASNFGWFNISQPRPIDRLNKSIDGYSNFTVTPPLPGYPLGRIYYGNAGNIKPNPDLIEFLQAQKVQGSPIEIDTSWLLIRHVDEIINFIPGKNGKSLLLIAAPAQGVKLLEELMEQGHGDAMINRDLSTQTTVKTAFNNKALMAHNLKLQRDKINPLITKLKQELQLTDDQIISVPIIFGYSGYSWSPNLINSVLVNGQLLVSDPKGAMINNQDYMQNVFRQLLANAQVNINFIDDKYYQELRENIGGAVNTTRQGETRKFWQVLPDDLNGN